jgi:hypothetical protein
MIDEKTQVLELPLETEREGAKKIDLEPLRVQELRELGALPENPVKK